MSRKTEAELAEIKKKKNEAKRKLTAFRQLNGLCTQCGAPVVHGKRLCLECLVKKRRMKDKRWNNEIPREMRPSLGICWRCGKKPTADGKTICLDCFSSLSAHAKEMMSHPSQAQIEAREKFVNDTYRMRGINRKK